MKHTTYMKIAYNLAQESKCCSWQVASVIVKDGRIISTGINGTPAGAINCCDHAKKQGWLLRPHLKGPYVLNQAYRNSHSSWSDENEIHAELNSIIFAAKNGVSIDGATMYVNVTPCPQCAKAIAQSGITEVFYDVEYDRNKENWYEILTKNNVKVTKIKWD